MGLFNYQNNGGGRGFNGRWLIAAVIAIMGVVSYVGTRQRNPVTGQVQHVALSVDQERAMGLQAAPQMAQQMGGAVDPNRDPDARLVSEVGQKIVKASDAGRSPYADNFHFRLLDDRNTVNAFALPGGQVFITRALFDRLENEAQLAGVLGHEIGHVIYRHSAQQMAKGQLGQMLATAAGVGSNDSRVAVAAQMADQMLQLKYGRGDESEADGVGVDYMAKTGYDPREMLGVMQILKTASGGSQQPQFLSTHPLPETRLHDLDQLIKDKFRGQDFGQYSKGASLKGTAGGKPKTTSDKW